MQVPPYETQMNLPEMKSEEFSGTDNKPLKHEVPKIIWR